MRKTLIFGLVMAVSAVASAQDRQFAWTYQSNILPVGSRDLEIWNTYSSGRTNFYHRLDQRIEFETGVVKNLQTALYLNYSNTFYQETENKEVLSHNSTFSFSNEWKYRLSNPSVNIIGSALYGEILIGPEEFELETKLILDKRFGNNLLAFNAIWENEVEYEGEGEEVETEWEMPIEFDLAYMYTPSPNFGIGIESRSHNILNKGYWESSALFAGPSIFVASEGFYCIFNFMPQLIDLKSGGKSLSLDDHEKYMARLYFGISI